MLVWIAGVAAGDDEIYVSALVFGEIRRGIERVRHRGDLAQANTPEAWLTSLDALYSDSGRILPIDTRVADTWGRLNFPNALPIVDGLLAATAIVHGLTLVTRNVRDVAATGVRCLNPFEAG